MKLDPAIIKMQIDQLILAYPELAEDEILRADMLEAETELHAFLRLIERKREDAVALLRGLESVVEDAKQRLARFDRREKAMRHLLFSAMQWADLHKIEMPEATLSIRQGTPKVVITDEAAIPAEYMRVKKEPDKTLIKAALADGFTNVPGATMSNAEPTLSVRVK